MLQDYESGKAVPDSRILSKLERVLGVKLRGTSTLPCLNQIVYVDPQALMLERSWRGRRNREPRSSGNGDDHQSELKLWRLSQGELQEMYFSDSVWISVLCPNLFKYRIKFRDRRPLMDPERTQAPTSPTLRHRISRALVRAEVQLGVTIVRFAPIEFLKGLVDIIQGV